MFTSVPTCGARGPRHTTPSILSIPKVLNCQPTGSATGMRHKSRIVNRKSNEIAMKTCFLPLLLPAAWLFSGCQSIVVSNAGPFSHFIGLKDFSGFVRVHEDNGAQVLLSPEINARIPWNQ